MDFDMQKAQTLKKAFDSDKSKKGSIDKEILPLLNLINSSQDYYTTSSCAGRIMLFIEKKKKDDSEWSFSSHSLVRMKEIGPYLEKLPQDTMWLRMEPPILHICARDMDSADRLVKLANDSGFRRSSLLGFKKRIIIEIMIPEKLDAPVSEKKKMIIDAAYLKTLLKHANSRLKKSRERLKKFEKMFISLAK